MGKFIMMRFLCFVIICGYCYGYSCIDHPDKDGPIVSTVSGSVFGKYVKILDTEIAAFLGIPYAEPPIDENRFMKPKPLARWAGILEAKRQPQACMQYSTRNYSWIPHTLATSEDCLYLNVWTPAKCGCSTPEKLPVMVWIYGGGFFSGSTDLDVYDGSTIASYGNVIVVSVNYRVGIFGFLKAGNDGAPGNMGLYDQTLALKWVKENIEFFGGDSNSITIFGESAGSISASLHMLSPMSQNLFNRAILQSGTALNPQLIDGAEIAYLKANTFAKIVGCISENSSIESDPEVLKCLKGKDALELAKAENMITSKGLVFFLPSYENDFMPVSPMKSIHDGHIAPIDVLIGDTNDEATIFLNYMIPDIFKLDSEPKLNLTSAENVIAALFHIVPNPPASEIFQQYFQNLTDDDDSSEIVKTVSHAFGDYVFNCPVKFFAEKLKKVHMYWYTHKSAKSQNSEWVGATHFDDVPFVFGVPIRDTTNYTPEDGRFSEDLIQTWTTFAKTGHPLGDKSPDDWPAFTSDQPDAFELSSNRKGVLTHPRTAACEYWRSYLESPSC